MHSQFPHLYEYEKRHREEELERKFEDLRHHEQLNRTPHKRRRPRWRAFISMIIGFFV